jgi:hypothetical protein
MGIEDFIEVGTEPQIRYSLITLSINAGILALLTAQLT